MRALELGTGEEAAAQPLGNWLLQRMGKRVGRLLAGMEETPDGPDSLRSGNSCVGRDDSGVGALAREASVTAYRGRR